MVEFKPDSQLSQNPFQPLSMEMEEGADSDTEGESDSDSSQLETNHNPVPPVNVVNAPSSETNFPPVEEMKEVVETIIPASSAKSAQSDTEEVKEMKEKDDPTATKVPSPLFSIKEVDSDGNIIPYCAHCCPESEMFNVKLGILCGQCSECSRTNLPYYWLHPTKPDCPFSNRKICYDCVGKYYIQSQKAPSTNPT